MPIYCLSGRICRALLYAWLRAITDGQKAPAKMIFFLKWAALEAFIQDAALTYWRLTCATKMGRATPGIQPLHGAIGSARRAVDAAHSE